MQTMLLYLIRLVIIGLLLRMLHKSGIKAWLFHVDCWVVSITVMQSKNQWPGCPGCLKTWMMKVESSADRWLQGIASYGWLFINVGYTIIARPKSQLVAFVWFLLRFHCKRISLNEFLPDLYLIGLYRMV